MDEQILEGQALRDLLDEPPIAECGRCHRKTWSAAEVAETQCKMPQPDGFPCGGRWMKFSQHV